MTRKARRPPLPESARVSKFALGRTFIPAAILLVAATFTAYFPCWNGSFIWDDEAWTTLIEPLFRDVSGLWQIWTNPTALQQYYPLTGTTFWIDHRLWGGWTLPYHLENILLHALSAVLFWRLLKQLRVPGAWLAGALFAVHPVMAESVAWITQRKNVLSMFFFLAALLACGRSAPFDGANPAKRARWMHALAIGLFACSLFSKITAVVLPPTLLLLRWWKSGRLRWREDVVRVLPFFALAAGTGVLVWWLEKHHVGAQGPEFAAPLTERWIVAGRSFWFYAGKLFWPANLCFVYPEWKIDPAAWWQWLAPLGATTVLLGVWLARNRIGRGLTVALWFYAGALFPVLGFMDTYAARYSRVWDHWVYLPSLGIVALTAALLAHGLERMEHKTARLLPAALLLALAALTWQECRTYRSAEVLWRVTLQKNPECWLAHSNLGTMLIGRGEIDESLTHFQRASELRPGYAEAWNNAAVALMQKGKPQQAYDAVSRALKIEPRYVDALINSGTALLQLERVQEGREAFARALEIDPGSARAESGLGLAILRAGDLQKAMEHFTRAAQRAPDLAEVRNNLGGALLRAGRLEEALQEHEAAVRLRPDLVDMRFNLGFVLLQLGRHAEAQKEFETILRQQPAHAEAHYNLGFLHLSQGRLEEARKHYSAAIALRPDYAQAHSSLGLVLLQLGHGTEAAASFEEALRHDPRLLSALNNLAWIRATAPESSLRDGHRALELAKRAQEVAGENHPGSLKTLAVACAESGDFEKAREVARRALELARQQGNSELAGALEECLRNFESNQPVRDPTIRDLNG